MEANDVTYWRSGSVFMWMVCLLYFGAALFRVHPLGGTSDSVRFVAPMYIMARPVRAALTKVVLCLCSANLSLLCLWGIRHGGEILNGESAGKCEKHLTYCNILVSRVTMCRTTCTVQKNATFFPHSVFICSVWISERTAVISIIIIIIRNLSNDTSKTSSKTIPPHSAI